MPQYTAPLRDMRFVMHEVFDVLSEYRAMPAHADLDAETIDAVLEEGARFASQVILPLNVVGDRDGCTISADGVVTPPAGFREAYWKFVEAGWPSLTCPTEFGGQALPLLLNNRVYEMFNASSQAWLMYFGLTHSAVDCLAASGSEELKRTFLPKLVSGHWSGTMCLTESHCGTDLGLLKTRAEAKGDGSYSLTGSKIFISSGEHDLSENIVHLVLARLPDAPAGSRGISLFLVPKFLPDADGNPGVRNWVKAGSIEHKMGIHGNATCVLNFDGARGWLVGEPNKGLPAMFVMMNSARLGVGMQSLGLAEVAYQNARDYARDRLQGRSLRGPQRPDKPADPIIVHPDVRRMLLTCKAYNEAARALTIFTAVQIDRLHSHPDAAAREHSSELLELLVPVVKAFITDNAFETTNLAMQVFGGHGFISEWGMEQFVRDARINMIYEGTNGIQAQDLLGRKVIHDGGAKLRRFRDLVQEFVASQSTRPVMAEFLGPLATLSEEIGTVTEVISARAATDPDEVGAVAVPYLRLVGHLAYAWLWARMAGVAHERIETGDSFHESKLATARFYYQRLLPETAALLRSVRSGAAPLMALDAELF